ncbi:hypothetical protein KJ765_03040 [Candidatus Micrarchaeota archaeon]|nr:hypothetical protein [Candidatus Micrarchaeota archaeon]
MNKIFWGGGAAIIVLAVLAFALMGSPNQSAGNRLQLESGNEDENGHVALESMQVTLYKSPSCGCCIGHTNYLRGEGVQVNIEERDDMASVKAKYNIPRNMQSCHTAVFGDYFVEGHIPLEAIAKLLEEQPDIDGIALPDMPAGSPGMPGQKNGDWTVYAIKDGKTSTFMVI